MRHLLAAAGPHVALKPAWARTIQLLRRARRSGHHTRLHSRAAVDQFLSIEPTETVDVGPVKSALKGVLASDNEAIAMECALHVDRIAGSWVPVVETGNVSVRLSSRPAWMTDEMVEQWLGPVDEWQTMRARRAATFLHHIDGLNIGGTTVRVDVDTPSGLALPPVQRSRRKRSRTRGRAPWLPFIDDEGRVSATPQRIAMQHGTLLSRLGYPVVDPFCGAGASAIGAALAGCTVRASDVSKARVALAKRNAVHFGVADRIEFTVCDARDIFEGIEGRDTTLFLDPPWGGTDWDRNDMSFLSLFGTWPALPPSILRTRAVMLKLPRTFQVSTLPARESPWSITLGIDSDDDHPADRIRLLTAVSTNL